MKITYASGKHVLQLEPKEVKIIIRSIRAMEIFTTKATDQLPEGMRPYRVIAGEQSMKVLAEMEQLYDMM